MMPPSRSIRSRGSYAKYICLQCRSRKIKCALPRDPPGPGIQQPSDACQRCKSKGLQCEVVNTTLGRPTVDDIDMTRRPPGTPTRVEAGDGEGDALTVDDYLLAQPESSHIDETATRSKKPTKSEKFDALFSPVGMLSMLVSRDTQVLRGNQRRPSTTSLFRLLSQDLVQRMDTALVWHRLFYPDLPLVSSLLAELQSMEEDDRLHLPTSLLGALLSRLSLDVLLPSRAHHQQLMDALDDLVYQLGQKLLFTLPGHRYSLLSLELMLEYAPFALTFDQITARYAVKGELHKALLLQLSATCPQTREDDTARNAPSTAQALLSSLQWCRIRLIDSNILTRRVGPREPSFDEVQHLLHTASISPEMSADAMHAFYTLLVQVQERDVTDSLFHDWRDLTRLDTLIHAHRAWCDSQPAILQSILQTKAATDETNHIVTTLLASTLHSSHAKITAHAMFLCIVSGARPNPSSKPSSTSLNNTNNNDRDDEKGKEEAEIPESAALETSQNLINRLTDPTLSQSTHTQFLAKHGTNRLEVLERTLLNYLRDAKLELAGVGFHPPARKMVGEILFVGRDVLEQNAARLKGWGALGARSEVFGLVMKKLGDVMGQMGRGEGLWRLGGRVMKGYVETLGRWERECAVGAFRGPQGGNRQGGEMSGEVLHMDDADFFIDWNEWLNDSPEL